MLAQRPQWESRQYSNSLSPSHSFPSSIHDYKIIAQIGKGAFGIVYEGHIEDRRVAIKALSKATIKSNNLHQRVRNEVSIHYQLQHPNILELLHFFEDSENVYLVMELAAGELYQRLRKQKLTVEEVRRIFAAVVDGLSYLHSHGIIHRDLKLSNILLTENLQPKIADFGLAVKIEGDRDCEQKTLCGTPNYLAPEVILKNPYGKTADLWSLGCLLYTLLVGRPPFESTDIRDTFSRVRRGDFRIPESVTPSARDLISKLIVLDPSQRISLEQIKRHPFLRPPVPLLTERQEVDKRPLKTRNLKPISQRTRHGTLEILSDGRLLVDFTNDTEILLISPDGTHISLYRKPVDSPNGCHASPVAEFAFSNLPARLQSRYEYGKRFVDLIRSKTPQVVLITEDSKAYLMDNADPADFQLRLSSGEKVEYSPLNNMLAIRDPDGTDQRYTGQELGDLNRISSLRHRKLVLDCLGKYDRCVQTARAIAKGRDTLPFPYIVRESLQSPSVADITAPQMRTFITSSMAAIPSSPSDAERSFEYAYKTHIPGVGWCLASAGEQFLLLFTDGQTVLIDGRRNRVAFHDRDSNGGDGSEAPGPFWHSIDQQLPMSLKQKLSFFPQFVNLLKTGHGHSFVS